MYHFVLNAPTQSVGPEKTIVPPRHLFPCGTWELGAGGLRHIDNILPPKTHNLIKLAEKTHISLTEDQKIFLDEVNDFNLEVRYPQFKNEFHKKCTKAFTERYFKQIESTAKWLKSQIKYLP